MLKHTTIAALVLMVAAPLSADETASKSKKRASKRATAEKDAVQEQLTLRRTIEALKQREAQLRAIAERNAALAVEAKQEAEQQRRRAEQARAEAEKNLAEAKKRLAEVQRNRDERAKGADKKQVQMKQLDDKLAYLKRAAVELEKSGSRDKLRVVHSQIREVEEYMHKLRDENAHSERRGKIKHHQRVEHSRREHAERERQAHRQRDELARHRQHIEHLLAAAEHLAAAGRGDLARDIAEEAEKMKRELHQHAEHRERGEQEGQLDEIRQAIKQIAGELHRLRRDVDAIHKSIERSGK